MFEGSTSFSEGQRMRARYLPIESVTRGMVLTEAVIDRFNRVVLPAGTELNRDTMAQLDIHLVRLVRVTSPDMRSAQDIAVDVAVACRRVLEIFEYADLTDAGVADLFNQVLTYRSA